MPLKICPSCSTKCGPRTKTCNCGYAFGGEKLPKAPKSKATHPRMPSGRKLTINEVQQYIAYEGMGDAMIIINPDRIEDKELATLWDKARKAVTAAKKKAYSVFRGPDNLYGADE
jgi:hypothetical protein